MIITNYHPVPSKPRLLYIMGIDWDWIYQRPQVLAELLASDYEVTVLFPRSILRASHKTNVPLKMQARILRTLPYQEKNLVVAMGSFLLNRHLFRDIDTFDYIYLGYPLYARYIPASYHGKIIYDCMDNYEALYPDQKRVSRILQQEQHIVRRCHLLLASSVLLKKKVDAIAGYSKSILVRNGVLFDIALSLSHAQKKDIYKLCYIGTVAEWFDYKLLLTTMNELPYLEYHLVGPVSSRCDHPKIHYLGIVPHETLPETVADFDCLVMPFCVNEIVKSVDPVKLYEYISFGKCIVSVYYPELEHFRDFVYFYETPREYTSLLRRLAQAGFPPKYNTKMQQNFLQNNTWQERYRHLRKALSEMEETDEDQSNECVWDTP